ncbi:hypothetical protein DACRYDRAFT_103717 [Dacryopinax primogenitus]|uniref:P-loop containing nucleoside triphosphate hydrolase protein n=1 Tax=Dacryopinax primogenitus (strain DJM 731) TaxID=1858805 RepID=M5GA70_DACPD|nr:uncharacterized protein DACRYDRAFT_103717 [Dacryopinax primogenitus]EJU05220.1 hypothetical protein DACRYDRAFT_103717 [Dacryopinax primogenitus]
MSDSQTTVTANPTIRVIGAGLGRTGTTSLKQALEMLGFGPCHHMSVIPGKPAMVQTLVDAYHGNSVDFKTLLAGYVSILDNPGCDFVPQLMSAFPEAKIILTVRDSPEVWWRSVQDTVLKSMIPTTRYLALFFSPSLFNFMRVPREVRLGWLKTYGELGPVIYVKHNAKMLEIIPKEKLLVYNVKEGWEPFFKKIIRTVQLIGITTWTIELGLVGLIVWQIVKRRLWEAFTWRGMFPSWR